jgi:type I restriction enzyme M protein
MPKATRSEALFVDCILNHLKPKGRAAIIVPEGVVFKNDNVFKALRKNLMQNGLHEVISLPSGVFQPYSGVKTSVLLIDKEIANSKNEILFMQIENDGFDPGSTKRPIEENDLPEALAILQD